jgi:hypothetical protein
MTTLQSLEIFCLNNNPSNKLSFKQNDEIIAKWDPRSKILSGLSEEIKVTNFLGKPSKIRKKTSVADGLIAEPVIEVKIDEFGHSDGYYEIMQIYKENIEVLRRGLRDDESEKQRAKDIQKSIDIIQSIRSSLEEALALSAKANNDVCVVKLPGDISL